MKTVKLTCQNCGANLDIKDNIAFCSYCGAKLVIDDENRTTTHNYNYNYTHTKRDEARIRENERKEKIRLQELENEEKQKTRDNKQLYFVFGFLIFIMLFSVGMSIYYSNAEKPKSGQIKMPCAMSDYKGEQYDEVVRELEDLGFYNIESAEKKDLVTGWVTKDGSVYKVSINGDNDFEEGDIFSEDAEVVVTYHTFKD